jgi:hypothetical protein
MAVALSPDTGLYRDALERLGLEGRVARPDPEG